MRNKWFYWYEKQVDKTKSWAKFRDRFLCPCCFMPTLVERTRYEICPICSWEDDGQDSDDAEVVYGGPNSDYSLVEARENVQQNHTMYRETDEAAFQRESERLPVTKNMRHAFIKAINSESTFDWENALKTEANYYKNSNQPNTSRQTIP